MSCTGDAESEANYPGRAKIDILSITQVLEVGRAFGTDAALIWAALLLKKRVAVYADRPSDLLAMLRVSKRDEVDSMVRNVELTSR